MCLSVLFVVDSGHSGSLRFFSIFGEYNIRNIYKTFILHQTVFGAFLKKF